MKVITTDNLGPGQRVLVRASLNVSLDPRGLVVDELRLRRTLQTIQLILAAGAIPILISHIKNDQGSTLQPVADWYRSQGYSVELVSDYFPYDPGKDSFTGGVIYIFENVRNYPGEKANDVNFARDLARYGDVYVNESFDSAHRSHASIVGLPTMLPSYVGVNFAREVAELSKVFAPPRPFTFIIGGAKIETKAPLITKLLDQADQVFIAGALMNPLLAARGINVGQSLMPEHDINLDQITNHPHLVLPVDFVDQDHQVIGADEITDDSKLLGIGTESIKLVEALIKSSRLVVWNGPLGNYEAGFTAGTDAVAQALAESAVYSIIGGGDTLAVVDDQTEAGIDWISTGGGAMLDFIESDGVLPAIEILNKI